MLLISKNTLCSPEKPGVLWQGVTYGHGTMPKMHPQVMGAPLGQGRSPACISSKTQSGAVVVLKANFCSHIGISFSSKKLKNISDF